MPDRVKLWLLRARSLERALKLFRQGHPEGLHDLRVTLRRTAATASAFGKKKVARRSRSLARSLSLRRQLEVDRQLLGRARDLGFLSQEIAAGLEARWDSLLSAGHRKALRVADGRKLRKLRGALLRLSRGGARGAIRSLERAWREAEEPLLSPPNGQRNRPLHRYRIAAKKARYLAEDLAACGVPGFEERIVEARAIQDALGRWNDLRLFRRRLVETREEAQRRGTVTLALELDRLIRALERTADSAKQNALETARRTTNVFPLLERSA